MQLNEQGVALEDVEDEPERDEMLDLINDIQEDHDLWIDNRLAGDTIPPNIKKVMAPLKRDVREDYDAVLVNSSHKRNGLGKSALSYWQARYSDRRFQIERNFFFKGNRNDITRISDGLPKFSPIIMDEIIRLMYKRRATSSDSIDFNIWLGADQRKTNQILIGNIPDFFDIDRYLREGKVHYWLEVLERGVGILFEADNFPKVDPWHEKEFDMLIAKRKRTRRRETLTSKIGLLKKHFCYRCPVFWPDFPKEDKVEYLRCVKHYTGITPDEKLDKKEDDTKRANLRMAFCTLRAVELMKKRLGATAGGILKEIGWTYGDYRKYTNLYQKQMQEDAVRNAAGDVRL